MENVQIRMQLHLTTNNDNGIKWFSKVNLKCCKYNHGLYMIEMYKQEIVYDKPIYVGTGILDLSKLCMMEFHYDVMHNHFKGKHSKKPVPPGSTPLRHMDLMLMKVCIHRKTRN